MNLTNIDGQFLSYITTNNNAIKNFILKKEGTLIVFNDNINDNDNNDSITEMWLGDGDKGIFLGGGYGVNYNQKDTLQNIVEQYENDQKELAESDISLNGRIDTLKLHVNKEIDNINNNFKTYSNNINDLINFYTQLIIAEQPKIKEVNYTLITDNGIIYNNEFNINIGTTIKDIIIEIKGYSNSVNSLVKCYMKLSDDSNSITYDNNIFNYEERPTQKNNYYFSIKINKYNVNIKLENDEDKKLFDKLYLEFDNNFYQSEFYNEHKDILEYFESTTNNLLTYKQLSLLEITPPIIHPIDYLKIYNDNKTFNINIQSYKENEYIKYTYIDLRTLENFNMNSDIYILLPENKYKLINLYGVNDYEDIPLMNFTYKHNINNLYRFKLKDSNTSNSYNIYKIKLEILNTSNTYTFNNFNNFNISLCTNKSNYIRLYNSASLLSWYNKIDANDIISYLKS